MSDKRISPSFCRCGVPWEAPCVCPESVLERFSEYHAGLKGTRVFYIECLYKWLEMEFSQVDRELVNSVLNLDGIVELGDTMYETPYEM